MKQKLMVIFGTRPEAIKMCPLVHVLRQRGEYDVRVLVTGQHREMLATVLSTFDILPDYDLKIMREGQDLFDLTEEMMKGIRSVLQSERPDLVLVHGDTTTAFSAALSAFYLGIPIGHVEAGLRTYDVSSPFPEEWNRRAIGLLAKYHFAPTRRAKENLLQERVPPKNVVVTGNTGIDALRFTVRKDFLHPYLEWIGSNRLILLTVHRRENQGEPMAAMLRGIRRIAREYENVRILYPVHPSPEVRRVAEEVLSSCERVLLTEPLDPVCFQNLLARAYFCVTDSGGIQEEAVSLGKPVLILRDRSERPEGIAGGGARLIGRTEGTVYRGVRDLLSIPAQHAAMSAAPSPYGDGYASERIAAFLEEIL